MKFGKAPARHTLVNLVSVLVLFVLGIQILLKHHTQIIHVTLSFAECNYSVNEQFYLYLVNLELHVQLTLAIVVWHVVIQH